MGHPARGTIPRRSRLLVVRFDSISTSLSWRADNGGNCSKPSPAAHAWFACDLGRKPRRKQTKLGWATRRAHSGSVPITGTRHKFGCPTHPLFSDEWAYDPKDEARAQSSSAIPDNSPHGMPFMASVGGEVLQVCSPVPFVGDGMRPKMVTGRAPTHPKRADEWGTRKPSDYPYQNAAQITKRL